MKPTANGFTSGTADTARPTVNNCAKKNRKYWETNREKRRELGLQMRLAYAALKQLGISLDQHLQQEKDQ